MRWEGVPGSDLVTAGLYDLAAGRESDAALLVLIGRPRLEDLGIEIPEVDWLRDSPEHQLYLRLAQTDSDSAHSRYNALIRRLISFERAATCAA